MQGLGLLLILSQFLAAPIDDSQSRFLGMFNILDADYSTINLADSLNAILGPLRNFNEPELILSSKSALVMDYDSGKVLLEKDADLRLPIASITKIMTALVTLDLAEGNLNRVVTVPASAASEIGSQMKLRSGEKMTVNNLLHGLLINSANDAAVTLSKTMTDSSDTFIGLMNEKAEELNLTNTRFANVTGLDTANHYSTSYDLAKLAQYALDNPTFAKIVSMPRATVTDVTGTEKHPLVTTNKLLGTTKNIIGVKTGTTDEAGPSLVAAAIGENGQKVIAVILDSPDRFGEGKLALDWAFRAYSWIEPL